MVEKIKEIEKVLHSTEKVTAKDMNNNPLDKNLKRKLVAYKVRLHIVIISVISLQNVELCANIKKT